MIRRGVWALAALAGRDYLTPEDIGTEASRIRVLPREQSRAARERRLLRDVLAAINDRRVEDYRLCAFVALESAPKDFARRFPRSALTKPNTKRIR